MIRSLRFPLGVVVLAWVCAACGPLVELPNSGPAPSLYTLTPVPAPVGEGTQALLLVEDPTAAGGLDSTLLARRSSPTAIQYYAGGRWADRPTVMLQSALVEAFELSGQHVSRGRGGTSVPADFELQTDLRDFQAEFFDGGTIPEVRVRLALTLVRLGKLATVGKTSIEITRRPVGSSLDAVVLAFDEAADEAMAEAVAWTIEQIKASR
ncbi:MAG: ABC-type transport auxiliary lipoprotein family protein [Alphaproteobacteria bacterium]